MESLNNSVERVLIKKVCTLVNGIFGTTLENLEIVPTPENFKGDFTISTFSLAKTLHKNPIEIATTIASQFVSDNEIKEIICEKAYLNITLQNKFWCVILNRIILDPHYGIELAGSLNKTIMIEFSSPNTNKPLHLGHIRNNLIGHSVSELYKAIGYNVIKANLVNDRGIHICKSMLAWQKWGNGETPHSSEIKGDHLVGKYYVLFDKEYKRQMEELEYLEAESEKQTPIMVEAHAMLRKWEEGDTEIVELWKLMNGWVYEGFNTTYKELGVSFDLIEYESDTYQLGKEVVMENLYKGLAEKCKDGSIWIDFTDSGLDRKLLLRSDGTSVYITQDIGTAIRRKEKYDVEKIIYVVAVEQQYHFKVLKLLLKHFGYSWYDDIYHLSYEMVSLPSGRMKSREGTVVDADDLMKEMTNHANKAIHERGDETNEELAKLIGLGSLKYHIVKVDPQKNILFDPSKTIDFQGNSGAFIQYTHARIKSILKLAEFIDNNEEIDINFSTLNKEEKELIMKLYFFKAAVVQAAYMFNPSIIAGYIFELSQKFNQFYHLHKVNTDDTEVKNFRLKLSSEVANILTSGAKLIGIELPDKM